MLAYTANIIIFISRVIIALDLKIKKTKTMFLSMKLLFSKPKHFLKEYIYPYSNTAFYLTKVTIYLLTSCIPKREKTPSTKKFSNKIRPY